jgi:hypothetical protein
VDVDIRRHLSMLNSERKARVFLHQDAELSISAFRQLVEKKFNSLYDKPFLIRYCLPGVMPAPRPLEEESDVHFIAEKISSAGSLQLYVEPSPGIFPPALFDYLINMPDPAQSEYFTILSFFKFYDIDNPEAYSEQLFTLWKPFKAVGRVYVANEGINAQCAVPTNVLSQFKAACETLPMFKAGVYLNVDHELSRKDFEAKPPFKSMHIRVREQIVADGFKTPLDWNKSGKEMAPLEWHKALDSPEVTILDCRNSYESEIGTFKNAVPLNTTFFRESWDALKEGIS